MGLRGRVDRRVPGGAALGRGQIHAARYVEQGEDPEAVQTMVGRLDMAHSRPMDCLAYRFDIVTRGELQT